MNIAAGSGRAGAASLCAPARQTRGAESPRRVLQVLLAFSEQRPHATMNELADEVGVPLSTCYRYVGLLREMGLIEDGSGSTYHVTPQIMNVARAARAANTLSQLALPVLQRICRQLNETTLLMQRFRSMAVCAESVAAPRAIRLVFEPGSTLPLGQGASGRLLLAGLPPAQRNEILAQMSAADPSFEQSRSGFEAELAECAERGWATSLSEYDDGIWGCAAAIHDRGQTVGTISVAGPDFRIPADEHDRIRAVIVEAAADVADKLAH